MQLAAGVRAGDILAGKYRVERVLGAGGMGVVVAAHHLQLDEKVAIKFLLPEMLAHSEAVGRFAREARAAVKIKSEHVARVLDVGTLETGAPYMVMEYLEGGDLGNWLKQRGPLAVEQAVEFLLQASVAVAEAHTLGIVHRDLKPANLFCVRGSDGRLFVKVLDFGISKMTAMGSSAQEHLTQTSALMGSLLYMSPEQMRSPKGVDARADIWALGVVLYELLSHRHPFEGETQAEVCIKIVTEAPLPVQGFRPDLPPGLRDVIATCLEKDRERRFRDVAAMAVALLPYGPRQSRAAVEKIEGIVHSARGLGSRPGALVTGGSVNPRAQTISALTDSPALEAPLQPRMEQTSNPVARTIPSQGRSKVRALGIAGSLTVTLVGALVAWRLHHAAVPPDTAAAIAPAGESTGHGSPPPAVGPSAAPIAAQSPTASAPALAPSPPPPVFAAPTTSASSPPVPNGVAYPPRRPPATKATTVAGPAPSAPPAAPSATAAQAVPTSSATPPDPLQSLHMKN
jgi:serine/threonine protein kinase